MGCGLTGSFLSGAAPGACGAPISSISSPLNEHFGVGRAAAPEGSVGSGALPAASGVRKAKRLRGGGERDSAAAAAALSQCFRRFAVSAILVTNR